MVIQIKSGMSVQIRRTDGRTHPAIVSCVNSALRSACVEWYENGETKGKEVEFETILSLNKHLKPLSSNIRSDGSDNKPKFSLPAVSNKRLKLCYPAVPRSRTGRSSMTAQSNGSCFQPKVKRIDSLTSVRQSRTSYNPATSLSQIAASYKIRRSSVVKEVEKLKKNREELKLRHAEKREKVEATMNLDPGNPNWQFSSMIRDYRCALDVVPLRETDDTTDHQITVCVRKRCLNKKELMKKEIDVITVSKKDTIIVHEPKYKVDLTKYLDNHQFRFDFVFDEHCTNDIVYNFTAKPLVRTVFEGGMATCFAYGQTGSGKTYTMGGTTLGRTQDCSKGIYAMAAVDIFEYLHSPVYRARTFLVTSSFFEIYGSKVFDLLADKALLRVLEDGKQQVQVVGLTEKVVNSVEEILSLIQIGNQARTSGQTSANSNSSRSHAVFQITLRSDVSNEVHGKFSLIDLAGNERGADTLSSDRLTRIEGAEINKSLLALKECIRALGRKGAHLPFRASKLTQVLRDSFIGDKAKTCMIAMISPGMSSCEHSLNTLRYADRVKELVTNDASPDNNNLHDSYNEEFQEVDNGVIRESLSVSDMSLESQEEQDTEFELSKLQEELLSCFKTWRTNCPKWDILENRLLEDSQGRNGFDRNEFATRLKLLIGERIQGLNMLNEKVSSFCQYLFTKKGSNENNHVDEK